MRKSIFLLLCIIPALTTFAFPYQYEKDGIWYSEITSYTDGQIRLKVIAPPGTKGGTPSSYTGDVVIPANIVWDVTDGYGNITHHTCKVIRIDDDAFYKSSITSISLPSTIEEIGISAFEGTDIVEIIIPEHCISIEQNAFRGCSKLNNLILNTVVSEDHPGVGVPDIWEADDVVFPPTLSQVTVNGNYLSPHILYGNTVIKSLDLSNVTFIDYAALSFTALESVTIGSLRRIGDKAFYGSNINDITLPETLTRVGHSAFYGCENLRSLQWPKSITTIPYRIVAHSGIEKFIIPEGVVAIGEAAISSCQNLENIEIPGSVEEIYSAAMAYNDNLKSVTMYPTVPPATNYNDIFCSYSVKRESILYVPLESLDAYINSYYSYYMAKVLPIEDSGVEQIEETTDFVCHSAPGKLIISSSCGCLVEVFRTDGTLAYKSTVDGEECIELPTGLYIVHSGEYSAKIFVK